MSRKHPIISITGSSGAGTTSVKKTFEQIFFREKVNAARLMGMIGTALLALAVLALIAIIGLAVAITPSGGDIGPNPAQVHHHGVSS